MNRVTSMGRGLGILSALAAHTHETSAGAPVTEIAARAGRDRSQASRILTALSASGLAERDADGYRLSPLVYASAQALTARRLRDDGLSTLEALRDATGEACFLGELSGDSTVTIAEALPSGVGLVTSWVGRAYPAYSSDAGQAALWDASAAEITAVLADSDFGAGGPRAARSVEEFIERLDAARARGYSIVDEEAEPGLLSVAAPVFDFRGEVVAAMQIVGARARLSARVDALGNSCAAAAATLSRTLAAPTPPAPAAR